MSLTGKNQHRTELTQFYSIRTSATLSTRYLNFSKSCDSVEANISQKVVRATITHKS